MYSTCWDALRDALPTEDFTGAPKVDSLSVTLPAEFAIRLYEVVIFTCRSDS